MTFQVETAKDTTTTIDYCAYSIQWHGHTDSDTHKLSKQAFFFGLWIGQIIGPLFLMLPRVNRVKFSHIDTTGKFRLVSFNR